MSESKRADLFSELAKTMKSLSDIVKEISESYRDNDLNDDIKSEATKNDKAENKVTLEDVRAVLAKLSQHGKTKDVKELITKYGASKLSEVDESKYMELLKEAEEIKID